LTDNNGADVDNNSVTDHHEPLILIDWYGDRCGWSWWWSRFWVVAKRARQRTARVFEGRFRATSAKRAHHPKHKLSPVFLIESRVEWVEGRGAESIVCVLQTALPGDRFTRRKERKRSSTPLLASILLISPAANSRTCRTAGREEN